MSLSKDIQTLNKFINKNVYDMADLFNFICDIQQNYNAKTKS